jgi:hypothetical protein
VGGVKRSVLCKANVKNVCGADNDYVSNDKAQTNTSLAAPSEQHDEGSVQ